MGNSPKCCCSHSCHKEGSCPVSGNDADGEQRFCICMECRCGACVRWSARQWHVKEITDEKAIVLRDDGPARKTVALLIYSSDDVASSHMLPEFDAVAQVLEERIVFLRVDVVENPSVLRRYEIHKLPTAVIFVPNQTAVCWVGPVSREAMGEGLRKLLPRRRSK